MSKVSPNAMLDESLLYVSECDRVVVCSAEPSSYSDAVDIVNLATCTLVSGIGLGDFDIADDSSGRKLTLISKTDLPIDYSGDATHVALVKDADETLRYITTCDTQPLVSGGTVDIPAWKINIQDPT